jgi:hypothetical protein
MMCDAWSSTTRLLDSNIGLLAARKPWDRKFHQNSQRSHIDDMPPRIALTLQCPMTDLSKVICYIE